MEVGDGDELVLSPLFATPMMMTSSTAKMTRIKHPSFLLDFFFGGGVACCGDGDVLAAGGGKFRAGLESSGHCGCGCVTGCPSVWRSGA